MHTNVAFIGLGIMGQRMLRSMTAHDGFTVTSAWDPDGAVCAAVRAEYRDLAIRDSAAAVIADSATDVVYIACPPKAHREYAIAAMDAGKPVFCEKPLGIDVAESRDLVAAVESAGVVNAVNFPFASAAAATMIAEKRAAGALGDVAGADVRLHFSRWPRGWQETATWLAYRDEGGFVREVLSHFVFLVERLFGAARVVNAAVRYPEGGKLAETHALVQLDCDGVPVTVAGGVGGVGPDRVEFTVWGSRASYRLWDWNKLKSSDGGAWVDELTHIEDPRWDGYMRQLDALAAQLAGGSHAMPGFREALSVQERIEEILAPS